MDLSSLFLKGSAIQFFQNQLAIFKLRIAGATLISYEELFLYGHSIMSQWLGGWKSKSRCSQDWFLLMPLFLACRLLSSHCVQKWPFLYVPESLASLLVLVRTPVLLDQDPTLKPSFNINYLSKGTVSKYRELGFKQMNLVGGEHCLTDAGAYLWIVK